MRVACLTKSAILPTRKHPTDAGLDLYADMEIDIQPHTSEVISTGITLEVPKYYFGWITNKSKSNFLIAGGIVDQDYQGEIKIKVVNYSDRVLHITHGQAIAQILFIMCAYPEVEEVLSTEIHKVETERGSTGGIHNTGNISWTQSELDFNFKNLDSI